MIPEVIGAVGLVFAAVITGIFHRMRRENDAAHGEAIARLDDIAGAQVFVNPDLEPGHCWYQDLTSAPGSGASGSDDKITAWTSIPMLLPESGNGPDRAGTRGSRSS